MSLYRGEMTFRVDGTFVEETLDRGEQSCSSITRISTTMGTVISEETTGPENDRVEEINSGL